MAARSRRSSGRIGGFTTPSGISGLLGTGDGRLALVDQAGGFVPFHERWPLGLVDQVEGLVASQPPAEYLDSLARAMAAWLSQIKRDDSWLPHPQQNIWPPWHERWRSAFVDQAEGLVGSPFALGPCGVRGGALHLRRRTKTNDFTFPAVWVGVPTVVPADPAAKGRLRRSGVTWRIQAASWEQPGAKKPKPLHPNPLIDVIRFTVISLVLAAFGSVGLAVPAVDNAT
jgi:hypothetical protein